MSKHPALARARSFCDAFNMRAPILMAPMAGACPASLAAAVANAGGLGACGALLMKPDAIASWARDVRAASNGGFQINLWIPDPAPRRDETTEDAVRRFLRNWGPEVSREAGDAMPPDFQAQCEALLQAGPAIVSSIMGLFPANFIARMQAASIKYFATATTVSEAIAAEAAGADVIIAQGMEAGGHRGAFNAAAAEARLVGLFSLLPAVVDAVSLPVVAAGGVADGRHVAAALLLGASAVQVGTAFLRSPEAAIPTAWADAIGRTNPEDTIITRWFSGRPGRAIATEYVRATMEAGAPEPAPYPVQRGLTQSMRDAGTRANNIASIQAWAGQSARMAKSEPAAEIVRRLWADAQTLLP